MTENNALFDKRILDRNLDKGLITQEQIAEHLKQLPDMEQESELLVLDSEDQEEVVVEDTQTTDPKEEPALNFDTLENQGPKNVYDF